MRYSYKLAVILLMLCLGAEAEESSPNTWNLSESRSTVFSRVLSPTANLEEVISSLPPTSSGGEMTSGFTLQLGAFPTEQLMQNYVDERGLVKLDNLQGHRTRRDGQVWYVVTWGHFENGKQASAAWQNQSSHFPGVDHWIRSVESLNKTKTEVQE